VVVMRHFIFQILQSDSTPVGRIMTVGLSVPGTVPLPPGAPLVQTSRNMAIVGGTGAFLGAPGQQGQERTPQTLTARTASMIEDPAKRRVNGGGINPQRLPARPNVPTAGYQHAKWPAVAHLSDFSFVSATNSRKRRSERNAPPSLVSLWRSQEVARWRKYQSLAAPEPSAPILIGCRREPHAAAHAVKSLPVASGRWQTPQRQFSARRR